MPIPVSNRSDKKWSGGTLEGARRGVGDPPTLGYTPPAGPSGGQGFTRKGLGGLRGVFLEGSGAGRDSARTTSTYDNDDDDDDDLGASLERPGRDMGV